MTPPTLSGPDRRIARAAAPRPTRHGRRRAFTLLEVVIVLVVIGIISAIAIPRYGRSLSRYRVDAAARRVAADLELARSMARSGSASRTVDFSAADNQYQLAGVPGLNDPASDYVVRLAQEPYVVTLVSAAFGTAPNVAPQVTFDRYGVPSTGGRVVLRHGDLTRTVTLDAHSGKAVVE